MESVQDEPMETNDGIVLSTSDTDMIDAAPTTMNHTDSVESPSDSKFDQNHSETQMSESLRSERLDRLGEENRSLSEEEDSAFDRPSLVSAEGKDSGEETENNEDYPQTHTEERCSSQIELFERCDGNNYNNMISNHAEKEFEDVSRLAAPGSDGELEDGELEDESDEETENVSVPDASSPKPEQSVTPLMSVTIPGDVSAREKMRHRRRTSPRVDSRTHPRRSPCTDSEVDDEEDQAVYVSGASPRKSEFIYEGEPYDDRLLRTPSPRRKRRRLDAEPRHKSNAICSYFMQGKCQRGRLCPFSHDATPPKKMELCKFYLMNCCFKKSKCLYMHKSFPCKFFHTGAECFDDAKCKFSHQPLSDITKPILLKHLETAPVEILGDFPRMVRSEALSKFEAASTRRENNEKPDFTFPNLEICRKRHLVNDVLEGHSSDSDRSVRVRRRRARHRSTSPAGDGIASDTSSSKCTDASRKEGLTAGAVDSAEDGRDSSKPDCAERSMEDDSVDQRRRGSRDRASSDKSSGQGEEARERGGGNDTESHSRRRREHRERSYHGRGAEDESEARAMASGRSDRRRQRNRDRAGPNRRERRHRSERGSHDRWERSRDRGEHGKYHAGANFSGDDRPPKRRGLLKTPEPEELLVQKRLLENSRYGGNDNFSRYSHALQRGQHMRHIEDASQIRAYTNGNDNDHHVDKSLENTHISAGGSRFPSGVSQLHDAPFRGAEEIGDMRSRTSPPGSAMQHSHLYKRIQQQQRDGNESAPKTQPAELTPQPSDEESGNPAYDDWYSSDDERTPIIDKVLKQMSGEGSVKKPGDAAEDNTISPAVSKLLSTLRKSTVHFSKSSRSADAGGSMAIAPPSADPRLSDQNYKRSGSRSPRQHVPRVEDPRSAVNSEESSAYLNKDDRHDSARFPLQTNTDPRIAQRHRIASNVRLQNTVPFEQTIDEKYGKYGSHPSTGQMSIHGGRDRGNPHAPTLSIDSDASEKESGESGSHSGIAPLRCWPEPSEELNIVAPVMRTDSDKLPFKLIDFHPCVEIDASLNVNCSIPWSLIEVDIDRRDYSSLHQRINDSSAPSDPRLRVKSRRKSSNMDAMMSSSAKVNPQSIATSAQVVHQDPRRGSSTANKTNPTPATSIPAATPSGYGSGIHVPPPPLNACLAVPPPVSASTTQNKGVRNMGAGLLPTPPIAMFSGDPLHNLAAPMPMNNFTPLNVLPEPSNDIYRTNIPPPVVLPQQPEARDPRLSSRGPLAPPF